MRVHTRTMLLTVVATASLFAAACGDDATDVGREPDPDEPQVDDPEPTPPEAIAIDVDCGDDTHEELTAGQQLAFDGTVTATRAEMNVAAEMHRTMLEDGVPDYLIDIGEDTIGEPWPWTTFEVHGWYTPDVGTEISLWTGGLDLAVGDRWLIAGASFGGPDFADHDAPSGLAVVCVSTAYTPEIAADWDSWFDGSVEPGSGEPQGEPDPDTVARIEAAREQWDASKPPAYTANIRVYTEQRDHEACTPDGQILVSVVEGQITDAVNVEQGCRLDPETPGIITIDDTFDLALTAAAAADDHWLEFHPDWPFPASFGGYDRAIELEVWISDFLPHASVLMVGTDPSPLDTARQLWEDRNLSEYRFVIHWGCFCGPETTGPFAITVAPGAEPVVEHLDGVAINEDFLPDLPGSVDEVFDLIEARAPGAHVVAAAFDAAGGHPVWVYVDEEENMVDEELTLTITLDDQPG